VRFVEEKEEEGRRRRRPVFVNAVVVEGKFCNRFRVMICTRLGEM
jgi:hypothetical protein